MSSWVYRCVRNWRQNFFRGSNEGEEDLQGASGGPSEAGKINHVGAPGARRADPETSEALGAAGAPGSPTRTNDETKQEELTCTICYSSALIGVPHWCAFAHLICEGCKAKLSKENCSICTSKLDSGRTPGKDLDKLLRQATFKCRYSLAWNKKYFINLKISLRKNLKIVLGNLTASLGS